MRKEFHTNTESLSIRKLMDDDKQDFRAIYTCGGWQIVHCGLKVTIELKSNALSDEWFAPITKLIVEDEDSLELLIDIVKKFKLPITSEEDEKELQLIRMELSAKTVANLSC